MLLCGQGFVFLLSLSSREEAGGAGPWLALRCPQFRLVAPQPAAGCAEEKARVAVFPHCVQEMGNARGNVTSRHSRFVLFPSV